MSPRIGSVSDSNRVYDSNGKPAGHEDESSIAGCDSRSAKVSKAAKVGLEQGALSSSKKSVKSKGKTYKHSHQAKGCFEIFSKKNTRRQFPSDFSDSE